MSENMRQQYLTIMLTVFTSMCTYCLKYAIHDNVNHYPIFKYKTVTKRNIILDNYRYKPIG